MLKNESKWGNKLNGIFLCILGACKIKMWVKKKLCYCIIQSLQYINSSLHRCLYFFKTFFIFKIALLLSLLVYKKLKKSQPLSQLKLICAV